MAEKGGKVRGGGLGLSLDQYSHLCRLDQAGHCVPKLTFEPISTLLRHPFSSCCHPRCSTSFLLLSAPLPRPLGRPTPPATIAAHPLLHLHPLVWRRIFRWKDFFLLPALSDVPDRASVSLARRLFIFGGGIVRRRVTRSFPFYFLCFPSISSLPLSLFFLSNNEF